MADRSPLPTDDIVTPRLLLRLMRGEAMAACLSGDLTRLEDLLQVAVSPALLGNITGFRFGQDQLAADPLYLPWAARAIILPEEKRMIGHVRFHSRPDPEYLHAYARNAVEFGYSIFPDFRRRGYASEAANAMMGWAQTGFGIRHFIVSISPENLPSLKLSQSLGFAKIGELMDDVDGMEHIFLRVAE
jgi:RimJ/RimL family protein N-acetyltransferase